MLVSSSGNHSHDISSHSLTNVLKPKESVHELTPKEEKEVRGLKQRDAEVRRHEQAHKAAAGSYAKGGPNYEYVTGPDGKRYAVGGEVQIDTSKVSDDPEATIKKAQTIRRAALAPQDPSSQDRSVAAEASRMESDARQELAKQKTEEAKIYDSAGQNSTPRSQPALFDLFI